jgi:hypothetical protein
MVFDPIRRRGAQRISHPEQTSCQLCNRIRTRICADGRVSARTADVRADISARIDVGAAAAAMLVAQDQSEHRD